MQKPSAVSVSRLVSVVAVHWNCIQLNFDTDKPTDASL